jgi:hypothetical protein
MHGYYQAHRRARAMAHRVAFCALCGKSPRAHSPAEHELLPVVTLPPVTLDPWQRLRAMQEEERW